MSGQHRLKFADERRLRRLEAIVVSVTPTKMREMQADTAFSVPRSPVDCVDRPSPTAVQAPLEPPWSVLRRVLYFTFRSFTSRTRLTSLVDVTKPLGTAISPMEIDMKTATFLRCSD
jgi:hypothetical protein